MEPFAYNQSYNASGSMLTVTNSSYTLPLFTILLLVLGIGAIAYYLNPKFKRFLNLFFHFVLINIGIGGGIVVVLGFIAAFVGILYYIFTSKEVQEDILRPLMLFFLYGVVVASVLTFIGAIASWIWSKVFPKEG